MPSTSAASRARATGTTIRASPCARVPCATASAPRIGRSSPVSDSSPANTQSVHLLALDLAARREDRHRERQVEARADLAQVRGREVDRDALLRELEARVRDRGAHPLARLPDRLVREPDDREGRQADADVGLDPDPAGVDAVEREGGDAGEAHSERPFEVLEAGRARRRGR